MNYRNSAIAAVLVIAGLGWACQPNSAKADIHFQLQEIPSPCQEGGEGNLFVDDLGTTYFSWVEYLNDTTDALHFAPLLADDTWGSAQRISQGSDWFVNWADFPSVAVFAGSGGKTMMAHWLQADQGGSTYDYDVRIALSGLSGHLWEPPTILHSDGIPAEHGFVTLTPWGENNMLAVWLDGRNTRAPKDPEAPKDATAHDHDSPIGAMTLRAAVVDAAGNRGGEWQLDFRVCDCCQTDAAITPNGPIVVYRDRSDEEIRDIGVIRWENGAWTTPQPLAADNWKIAGCPVNGPAISTYQEKVAVAWFTGAGETPKVQVCFSPDQGKTFSAPILIDGNNPLGRVDIEWLNDSQVVVSWLGQTDSLAQIQLQVVNTSGAVQAPFTAIETSSARSSGFPILARDNRGLILAWTAVDDQQKTRVKTARISVN